MQLQGVSLDEILAATAQASARIVILGAKFERLSIREPQSRDTAFGAQPRDTALGPPMTSSGANLLVAYAGSPGGTVIDGGDENSPYAAALLRHLEGPRSTVFAMFGAVAADVFEETGGKQAPTVYSTLTTRVKL